MPCSVFRLRPSRTSQLLLGILWLLGRPTSARGRGRRKLFSVGTLCESMASLCHRLHSLTALVDPKQADLGDTWAGNQPTTEKETEQVVVPPSDFAATGEATSCSRTSKNMPRSRLKSRQASTGQSSGLAKQSSTASERKRKTYDALEYTRNRMGLKPVIETRPGTHSEPELWWLPRMRLMFREPLLEFWGVLVMMLLGGSVTAVTVSS